MTRSHEERQAYAVARAMQRRRVELAPVRAEMADLIDNMGWRQARPLIHDAIGRPVKRAGLWKLGKRDTHAVLAALKEGPRGQGRLFGQAVTSATGPGTSRPGRGGDGPR